MRPLETTAAPALAETEGTPSQTFATEGLAEMGRPDPVTRMLMRILALVERLNLRFARYGAPCVYDKALFPWIAAFENQWLEIRAELDAVMTRRADLPPIQTITPDARSITKDEGWKIFLFTAYGVASPENIALCPKTWALVQTIPGVSTAMFSVFEPGKSLPPHRGPYNGVLRFHFGLIVPKAGPDALAIRVGDTVLQWREGEGVVFDDAYEHAAWNLTDQPRVVLFVDFPRPLYFPFNLINRAVLRLARHSAFLREGEEGLRAWEARFHKRG